VTVYLRYRADVWVEVDLEEGYVDAVTVDDASLLQPVEAIDASGVLLADAQVAARVRQIADVSEWPSWDFGEPPLRLQRDEPR
jgi:hypothetical protein